ncbi:MAG: ABC transporter ATP-binding protein [Clostridiales bacterium]|jgi:oligopeptide transport system ATP-binding protein|nr:ABC transporter ATP-binding protein [Clostridiales bacterium]
MAADDAGGANGMAGAGGANGAGGAGGGNGIAGTGGADAAGNAGGAEYAGGADGADAILKIRGLEVAFKTTAGTVRAVRGIDLDLRRGQTFAIVGESGSGKSVAAKAIVGIRARNQSVTAGTVEYAGAGAGALAASAARKAGRAGGGAGQNACSDTSQGAGQNAGRAASIDLLRLSERDMRRNINGRRISMIFQDPMTSLNPTMPIGRQIMEPMLLHSRASGISRGEARAKALRLLELAGIPDPAGCLRAYPHQLSGGMRQRAVISVALACDPEILICDEPTTALDVTIQEKILRLIKDIQRRTGICVVYITHDLGVVAKVADMVAVMYAGRIVESGTAEEIFYDPRHPYTWGLLLAVPDMNASGERLHAIRGNPPNLLHGIEGDAFAPRSPHALKIDARRAPPLYQISPTHFARSWLLHENARPPEMPGELRARIDGMIAQALADARH